MMNRGDRQDQNHQRMMIRLNLTEEQKTKIEEIHLNGQKAMIPLRHKIREKNAQLRRLKMSEEYDETAVNVLIEEIGELRTAMMVMRTAHMQQVRELLTPEQRIKFDAHQQNSMKRQSRFGMK